jgi:ferritin-like metal-binding protein YciE
MSMNTPRDLFLHELSDALSAEHIIAKMLPTVAGEVDSTELRDALREHEKETRQHIKNLEAAFKELGEQPEQMTCHGAEGLQKEVDSFLKEKPAHEILTLFAAGAAGKTEQYEIQSYTGLIDMAKLLGEKEVAKLLQENLKQEEAMAKKVEALEKKLGKELIPPMLEAEQTAANAD